MPKNLFFFFIILLLGFSFEGKAQSLIPFGNVRLGEARIPIELKSFEILVESKTKSIEADFIQGSVQWIRDPSNLLIPRARLLIRVEGTQKSPYAHYLKEVFGAEKKDDSYTLDLWVNLFNPAIITIKVLKEEIGKITFRSRKVVSQNSEFQETKLIDYSCAPYDLKFTGLENQYMSVGCRLEKMGEIGQEKPRLVVTWSATNYLLPDGSRPPFKTVLKSNAPSVFEVQNRQGQRKTVTIEATLPKRLHRLKTAFGFGPYLFESQDGNRRRPEKWAPSFMLYGNYEFFQSTSLRFFNATVSRGSLFNNGGLYLAYELASLFDNRFKIVPLLGAQILTFDYNDQTASRTKIIYPQGFEAVYQHAFGFKNFSVVYGMFLSGSNNEPYKNLWLRAGKKIFGEINYIEWSAGQRKVKTYGLSLGLPLASFF